MKKLLLVCAMTLFGFGQTFAQLDESDFGFFNHLNAGISVGTDGIGIDVAAPLTYNFAVRAGYTFMPKFKYTKNINLDHNDALTKDKVDLEGKLNMGDFHLLFDYYPFKSSSFHLTAGAYIGKSKVVTVTNAESFVKPSYWGNSGIELGTTDKSPYSEYTLYSDDQGNIQADMKTNGFKPYVGVGFGRAVCKGRFGIQFDLGVQFWGTPEVWTNLKSFDYEKGDYVMGYRKVAKNRITNPGKDYKDIKDAVKTIEKIGVYPVLKLRINGRIF